MLGAECGALVQRDGIEAEQTATQWAGGSAHSRTGRPAARPRRTARAATTRAPAHQRRARKTAPIQPAHASATSAHSTSIRVRGNGNQDGLLPALRYFQLLGRLGGPQGKPAANDDIRDIEGNLREIVKDNALYRLMGGAFNSQSEDGAACGFSFYTDRRELQAVRLRLPLLLHAEAQLS